jgi:hypothetical protein
MYEGRMSIKGKMENLLSFRRNCSKVAKSRSGSEINNVGYFKWLALQSLPFLRDRNKSRKTMDRRLGCVRLGKVH